LTFTCFQRHRFLASERTCRWLADAIEVARERLDFSLWAFVFMPDHAHLIVLPRRAEHKISGILGAIKEPVGRKAIKYLEVNAPQWLPRITRRRGQRIERLFWQSGGGFDRNIFEPTTLMAMIEFLHLNPVRQELVERTLDWRWSSAGWFLGEEHCGLVPDPIPPEWTTQN
jgi:putative transposase